MAPVKQSTTFKTQRKRVIIVKSVSKLILEKKPKDVGEIIGLMKQCRPTYNDFLFLHRSYFTTPETMVRIVREVRVGQDIISNMVSNKILDKSIYHKKKQLKKTRSR